MKDDAKRPTAGTKQGRTKGRGRFGIGLLTIALVLLALAPHSQAKVVASGFGTDGDRGGQFGSPRGIAVNSSGNGAPAGTTYVVDSQNRVQRFDPDGEFELTWGQNVIGRSEVQRFSLSGFTGGSFSITVGGDTTAAFPITFFSGNPNTVAFPSTGMVANALAALPSIGAGNVQVSDGSLTRTGQPDGFSAGFMTVTFVGVLAGVDMPQLVVNTGGLDGPSPAASVTTIEQGVGGSFAGFEICEEAVLCKAGETGGTSENGGQLNNPRGVAVNQANGHVYVTEQGNRRISEFDADGGFVRTWGWDVVKTGGAGDVSTDDFEICTVAADCKQAAAAGDDGGRFAAQIGYPVTDSSNGVWIADAANERIQKFDPEGAFIAAYGWNVDALGGGGELEECISTALNACQAGVNGTELGKFSANSPQQLAFDSAGNLYALDAGTNDRVQEFDPALTTASDFGAATFDAFTTQAPESIAATASGTALAFGVRDDLEGGSNFQNERQIVELGVGDASVLDTSLVDLGLNGSESLPGLKAAPSGDLYATTTSGTGPRRVLVLADTPPALPSLTVDSIGSITDTSATFNGSINPGGGLLTNCQFQYSTDQVIWVDVPALPACSSFSANDPQTLSATVEVLDPNTQYFVRLQASRPLLEGSTATSVLKTFHTDAVPPVVTDVGAVQIADTSARLVVTIDPRHSPTGYVFEYGKTPALGSSTAPLEIGDGTDPITVSQVVGGLNKDTTYYFRALATNLTGGTTSSSKTFRTRTIPFPGLSIRAYEQVSPVDKNYGDVDSGYGLNKAGVSVNGDAVGFCASNQFGEPPGQMATVCSPYITRRGADGWRLQGVPGYCHVDPVSGDSAGALSLYPSADFSRVVVHKAESEGCPVPPLDPAAPMNPDGHSINLYRQDPFTSPPIYDLLHTATQSGGEVDYQAQIFAGGSDDLSKVVVQSKVNQTPQPDSPPPGSFAKLYEWENGALSLVSRDPSDEPFTTGSSIPAIGFISAGSVPLASHVSEDGERIFFANPVGAAGSTPPCGLPGCQIYMREGGAETLDVSAAECTFDCGSPQTKADYFLSATPSGEKAFFTSCAKLTDEASPQKASPGACDSAEPWASRGEDNSKLYRWDRSLPPGARLVDLTADHEPGDGDQPGFLGLIGHSDDGDTAYFVTRRQIVSGEPTFPSSEGFLFEGLGTTFFDAKLYRWQWNGGSPEVDYIGPYQSLRGRWSPDMNWMQQRRQVTPDGEHLMIYTKLAYDAAVDRDEDADVYRWSEPGGWICVSCQLPGAPSGGDVDLSEPWLGPGTDTFIDEFGSAEPRIYMSDDGRRIFFGTPDALVPGDTNGEVNCLLDTGLSFFLDVDIYTCADVYEWHDGALSLISSGTSPEASRLIAASASGRDVLFNTRDRLVGWDLDNNMDIYDARIGGGFPEPAPQPPECEGEGCREEGSDAPEVAGAGTAVFQGSGNPKAEAPSNRCPGGKLRRGKRCLTVAAVARKRCRRLDGAAKRRCIRNQARRLRRAKRRANRRAHRRMSTHRIDADRRAAR